VSLGAAAIGAGLTRTGFAEEASPVASPAATGSGKHLLVADKTDAKVYIYSIPDFELTGQLDDVVLSGHGGTLTLPDGRVVFSDPVAQEILELTISAKGAPEITNRVAGTIGVDVAWTSADADLKYVAIGSIVEETRSQTLNIVNLETFENTALEFELVEDEELISWLIGDPLHIHVGLGGQINSYALADLLEGKTEPLGTVSVELGSHGGVTDIRNNRIFLTTGPGFGFDVLDVSTGSAAYVTQIPWDVDGLAGGRNARPRLSPDGIHIFGQLAPTLEDPTLWADNQVSVHIVNVDDLGAVRNPVGTGLFGGRWGMSEHAALLAGYNADGGTAYLIDTDATSATFGTVLDTIDIPVPVNSAVPGEDMTGKESYFTAVTADGAFGFVAIHGDGAIEVLDLTAASSLASITLPSLMTGGGYIAVIEPGVIPVDSWGR
jgi:hypothetical protein